MKKIFNIFLTLAAVASLAVSCKQEEPYEPGPQDLDGCYGVFFPSQEATGAHTYDPTMATETEILVSRKVSDDAITVPYQIIDPNNIFSCGEIHFDNGQSETTLTIDFSKAEIGVKYPLTVIIDDPQYASSYGDGAIAFDFSVFRVEWKLLTDPDGKPATVTFYETWWDEIHECLIKYYEIGNMRTCVAYTEDPKEGVWGMQTDFTFTWNTTTNKIDIPQNFMGWDYDDQGHPKAESECSSPVYVFDWYSYFFVTGQYTKDVEAFYEGNSANYPRSYYDPETGIFYFNVQFYIIGLGGWTGNLFDTEGWVSGFTRVDYSIEAETDYSYEGEVPVYFTTGVDVAEIKYVAVEGELTATQAGNVVAAIIDGSQEGIESITDFEEGEDENYASLALTFDKTGKYTVVAVSYDEAGEAKENASVTVNFIAAEDEEAYAVDMQIGAEAVPARYGVDPYTTMAYWIAGSELTEVHMIIAEESQIDAALSAIRNAKYAVSEENLAKINEKGGLYTYATGLKAGTDYCLIVWGTNGSLDTVYGAYYSTPKLPYVWNKLGTGLYTDDTVSYIYGYDPVTVEVEVYQEAKEKNLIMFKGHALALAADAFEVSTEVMARYEGTYWKDCEIILDVADPSSVVWDLQDYGICLNSADGFFDGLTNMAPNGSGPFSKGIFKDGVISFPTVKGMLCTIGGEGYYYANGTGSTKLVLPEAVPASSAVATKSATNGYIHENFDANAVMAKGLYKIAIERDIHNASFTAKSIARKADDSSSKEAPAKFRAENIVF